jgi:hypothetical protein
MSTSRKNKGNRGNAGTLTPDSLRTTLRERGIAESLTEFADQIERSRQAIYFALENPKRFPLTYRRIITAIE